MQLKKIMVSLGALICLCVNSGEVHYTHLFLRAFSCESRLTALEFGFGAAAPSQLLSF